MVLGSKKINANLLWFPVVLALPCGGWKVLLVAFSSSESPSGVLVSFPEEDLEGKTEEEIEMMKTMGFASFDTTKVHKYNIVAALRLPLSSEAHSSVWGCCIPDGPTAQKQGRPCQCHRAEKQHDVVPLKSHVSAS